jgi:hypothetical protein
MGEYEQIMRKFPVRGRILREWVIPAREYSAFTMWRGQVLRVVDVEGKQVPDIVSFNEHDVSESLNMGYALLINKRRELVKGDILPSVICNTMMTIHDYSNAESYAYGVMCSEEVNRIRYGVSGTRNCRDNLTMALAPWGIGRRYIPTAFKPFMRTRVEPDGSFAILEPTTQPGDFYDMRAEMDLVVGISNCPQERNPCNGFNPTPLGIIIYELSQA